MRRTSRTDINCGEGDRTVASSYLFHMRGDNTIMEPALLHGTDTTLQLEGWISPQMGKVHYFRGTKTFL